MKTEYRQKLNELLVLTEKFSSIEGIGDSAISCLKIIKASNISDKIPNVYRPSLCVIVQGSKDVILADEIYSYSPGEFIVTTVDLPVSGSITKAVPNRPYLCLMLEIEPSLIYEILKDFSTEPIKSKNKRGIFVGELEYEMLDAFVRLLTCLKKSSDIEVLSPLIIREIVYRLLISRYGDAVKQLGIVGSQVQRIAKAIEVIKNEFSQTLRMEGLAEKSGMSQASFHKYFKDITAMSPLQFQKQIRLQEARKLLLSGNYDAATVSYEVGYSSPSQFSREYARMFGLPPKSDIKHIKR